MSAVRIAVAELAPVVGAFSNNRDLIVAAAKNAAAAGAHMLAVGEMALCGYPIEDLAVDRAFVNAARDAAHQLAADLGNDPVTRDLVVVVGSCWPTDALDSPQNLTPAVDAEARVAVNAAVTIRSGHVVAVRAKHLLPTYSVFDEARVFAAGPLPRPFDIRPVPTGGAAFGVGVAICEDLWTSDVSRAYAAGGADVIVAINASPYHAGKPAQRAALVRDRALECGIPVVYVNRSGSVDDIVFDGGTIAADANGAVWASAAFVDPDCGPQLRLIDIDADGTVAPDPAMITADADREPVGVLDLDDAGLGELYKALVVGTRSYVNTIGFKRAVVGCSGGIDSALVATIAVDALGAGRVLGVTLPGPYSSGGSVDDSVELADRCGFELHQIGIGDGFDALTTMLGIGAETGLLTGTTPDVTEENIQARLRGIVLMAAANKLGGIVLSTSNKSEAAVGYGTLYGDLAGGLSVIRDIPKSVVWALARWRNANRPWGRGPEAPIPVSSITKPPSAELAPGQADTDSLPEYPLLDAVLEVVVGRRGNVDDVLADPTVTAAAARYGVTDLGALARRVMTMVARAEHKRRQAPLGLKVTSLAFGRDRRLPIMSAWPQFSGA